MGSAEAGSPRHPQSRTWAWDTCLVSTGRDGGPRSLDATQPLRLHKLQSVGKGQPRASSASQPRHSKADQEKGCVHYYSKWNRGHFEEDLYLPLSSSVQCFFSLFYSDPPLPTSWPSLTSRGICFRNIFNLSGPVVRLTGTVLTCEEHHVLLILVKAVLTFYRRNKTKGNIFISFIISPWQLISMD